VTQQVVQRYSTFAHAAARPFFENCIQYLIIGGIIIIYTRAEASDVNIRTLKFAFGIRSLLYGGRGKLSAHRLLHGPGGWNLSDVYDDNAGNDDEICVVRGVRVVTREGTASKRLGDNKIHQRQPKKTVRKSGLRRAASANRP
jgi:hypothetical protein